MATYKAVIFPGKNHTKSDGTTNVKIRIYHNSQSQYLPTNYYIFPAHMMDSGNICGPNSELLNFDIGNTIQKYRGAELKIGVERTRRMSCSELRDFIQAICEPEYEFIDFNQFSENYIAQVEKQKTKEWLETSLRCFTWYIKSKKIDARDITSKLIQNFVKQLQRSGIKDKPLTPGAISNYLRGLRVLYNQCKSQYNDTDHQIIRIINNPFSDNIIPKYRRSKKNVAINNICRIRDYDPKTKRQEISRDMFMAMFYLMGINVNDFFNLDKSTFDNRLIYYRSKTKTDDNIYNYPLSIRIEPELHDILSKYSDRGLLSAIKLRYSNSYNFMKSVNKGLSEICSELKITKITTNWARHSWASIARNKAGINVSDIDFCLGHVNHQFKTADIYIEIDYGIFDICNRKVIDLLK